MLNDPEINGDSNGDSWTVNKCNWSEITELTAQGPSNVTGSNFHRWRLRETWSPQGSIMRSIERITSMMRSWVIWMMSLATWEIMAIWCLNRAIMSRTMESHVCLYRRKVTLWVWRDTRAAELSSITNKLLSDLSLQHKPNLMLINHFPVSSKESSCLTLRCWTYSCWI